MSRRDLDKSAREVGVGELSFGAATARKFLHAFLGCAAGAWSF